MSASSSTGAIGASTLEGDAASFDESTPSKWTSPPNAKVTGLPLPSGVACSERATCGRSSCDVGLAAVEDGGRDDEREHRRRHQKTQPPHGHEISGRRGIPPPRWHDFFGLE